MKGDKRGLEKLLDMLKLNVLVGMTDVFLTVWSFQSSLILLIWHLADFFLFFLESPKMYLEKAFDVMGKLTHTRDNGFDLYC